MSVTWLQVVLLLSIVSWKGLFGEAANNIVGCQSPPEVEYKGLLTFTVGYKGKRRALDWPLKAEWPYFSAGRTPDRYISKVVQQTEFQRAKRRDKTRLGNAVLGATEQKRVMNYPFTLLVIEYTVSLPQDFIMPRIQLVERHLKWGASALELLETRLQGRSTKGEHANHQGGSLQGRSKRQFHALAVKLCGLQHPERRHWVIQCGSRGLKRGIGKSCSKALPTNGEGWSRAASSMNCEVCIIIWATAVAPWVVRYRVVCDTGLEGGRDGTGWYVRTAGQRETRIRENTLSSEWYSTPMTAESQWDTSYLMPNKASLRERMTLPTSGLSSTGGFTAHRESISPTGEHKPYGRQSQLKLSFGPPGDPSGFTVEPLECNSDRRIKMSPVANDATEFRLK
ncbi:hypothetical protein C8F04DRAFT_1198142 [Mycena alexandri]|uniref:Uncharacterized protein n=1 Tax=Mycena alexandri TaxID=1745969 RepID=A0AAD6S236_9AGAR|nr:hypothetical protein C8F04DRAFT_1198142 [Mycena alexandri]